MILADSPNPRKRPPTSESMQKPSATGADNVTLTVSYTGGSTTVAMSGTGAPPPAPSLQAAPATLADSRRGSQGHDTWSLYDSYPGLRGLPTARGAKRNTRC